MRDFSVLIPVALPSSGPELLRIARLLAPVKHLSVTALHCRLEPGLDSVESEHHEIEADLDPLEPLLKATDDVRVDAVHIDSSDVEGSILTTARERGADLVLMGWHRPVVPDDESMGPVRGILERAETDVAIYLPRQPRPFRRCLVPFHGGRHDRRGLELAARIARSADVPITVLHIVTPDREGTEPGTGLSEVVEDFSDGRIRLKVIESDDPVAAAINETWDGYDLIVAGASEVWGGEFSLFPERLQQLAFATPASLLVVHACSPRRPAARDEAQRGHTYSSLH